MTIQKLIDKYSQMLKDGYELVSISQVLIDLRNAQRQRT